MKQWKLVIALLSVLALFATACGSDATDAVSDAAESVVETTEDAAEAVTDAVTDDDEEEAMEEEAMEEDEEEAMEDEEEAAPAASGGADGGDLLLLQWQAPSQANAHLSSGSKDVLASSLALEPLANITPDGEIVPRLAAEIPTASNGGISEDLTQITWTLQDGILWSDGTPFTSADVVFTYEYCADELTGCTTADAIADVESCLLYTSPSPRDS